MKKNFPAPRGTVEHYFGCSCAWITRETPCLLVGGWSRPWGLLTLYGVLVGTSDSTASFPVLPLFVRKSRTKGRYLCRVPAGSSFVGGCMKTTPRFD